MTRPMSAGLMSSSARASATERLTTRQSSSTCCGPPTPVSTSTAPPGWVTTNPCTGQRPPSRPCRLARCNRFTSSAMATDYSVRRPTADDQDHGADDEHAAGDRGRRQPLVQDERAEQDRDD